MSCSRLGGFIGAVLFLTSTLFIILTPIAGAEEGQSLYNPPLEIGRWDYLVSSIKAGAGYENRLESQLVNLGAEGWELVGVVVTGEGNDNVTVFLKRSRR